MPRRTRSTPPTGTAITESPCSMPTPARSSAFGAPTASRRPTTICRPTIRIHRNSPRRTASRWPRTVWSSSATAPTTACRCFRRTAASCANTCSIPPPRAPARAGGWRSRRSTRSRIFSCWSTAPTTCWKRCAAATAPWSAPSAGRAAKPANSTGCMSASSTRGAIFIPAKSIPVSGCRNGCRWSSGRSRRRQNNGAALAEADPWIAGFCAKAAEDDLVCRLLLEKKNAARQFERFAAACAEFKEATPTRFVRARHGARSDQIADLEVAAVAGLVGDHLCDGPIHQRERGFRDARRRGAVLAHGVGQEIGFQRDVEPAVRLIVRVGKMRQRGWIAFRPRISGGVERRQRLRGYHPWRDRGAEILAEERPERLIFPALEVARRPVVEQGRAKYVLGRFADRNHSAELGTHADEGAELELEIEIARRSVTRHVLIRTLALALRSLDRRTADAHRRGAAVIGDRHVFVIRHQRIVRTEHAAGIAGVKNRGEKIGEVAERHRQPDLRLRHRGEMLADVFIAVLGAQGARQAEPQSRPSLRPERHDEIEERRRAGARRVGGKAFERGAGRRDIENLVADRDADPRRHCRGRAENAERQVLDREFALRCVGAFDPAAPGRIVGFVEG